MKHIHQIILLGCACALAACSSVTGLLTGILSPSTVQNLTAATVGEAVSLLPASDRSIAANYGDLFAGVLGADSGAPVTAAQLQADLAGALPSTGVPAVVTNELNLLVSFVTPYLPKITGNWATYMVAIETGVQAGNAPYISTATTASKATALRALRIARQHLRLECRSGHLNARDPLVRYALSN